MIRSRVFRALCFSASVAYVATSAIHMTGFGSITRIAKGGPADLHFIVPALWISFSLDLVVLGFIFALLGFIVPPGSRPIALLLSLPPLFAAVLQLIYLGFIPPTAILIFDSALALASGLSAPQTHRGLHATYQKDPADGTRRSLP